MKTKKIILCSLFICLITVGAYIKIPLPAVPLSLQLPFVILCGMLLDRKSGILCALVYLIMGLLGLPVFSAGGGISYILQPTFGYIIGFIPCAFIVSTLSNKKNCTSRRYLFSAIAGAFTVHIIGLVYFLALSRFYLNAEIDLYALVPPLLAALTKDVVMCFLGATVGKRLRIVSGIFLAE